MRTILACSLALLSLSTPAFAETESDYSFDWQKWQALPVQDGGRQKPLDTLAWETLRTLSNRAGFADPETEQKLDPTALYLAMLFDWQGWDKTTVPRAMAGFQPRSRYFAVHQADKWDQAPLLRVDFLALREALGMDADQKYISPLELSEAGIHDPDADSTAAFLLWVGDLIRAKQQGFTLFEKKALELADKFWAYQDLRMGKSLQVAPSKDSQAKEWLSIAYFLQSEFDDQADPSGQMREVQQQFLNARTAYLNDSAADFNRASSAFVAAANQLGPTLGDYPRQTGIDLEVGYNRWVPFRFAWVATMLASIFLLVGAGSKWRPFYWLGWTAFLAGLIAMLVGFGLRIAISGRAPVTNMYESVVYLGLGTAILGVVFELIYRKQFVLTAAAAVTTVALILADNCPAVLDPSFRPLQPVLRSNFWLVTHVMSITLSYAAFALALGISNITLGYYLVGSHNRKATTALSRFTYKSLQVGVLLLAIGTILGGVWADYAWGRFWGWDPKEVWALIALLGYLAVLHARYVGWVRDLGLASLSVICFMLVVMAWYGVNFILGAGLHSYGFGGGGQNYVYATIAVQLLYVAVAVVMGTINDTSATPEDPVPENSLVKPTSPALDQG